MVTPPTPRVFLQRVHKALKEKGMGFALLHKSAKERRESQTIIAEGRGEETQRALRRVGSMKGDFL